MMSSRMAFSQASFLTLHAGTVQPLNQRTPSLIGCTVQPLNQRTPSLIGCTVHPLNQRTPSLIGFTRLFLEALLM